MIDFFSHNIVIVYFFYGLSFFCMGFAILLELGHASELDFARALRPLAIFGIVHGSHEWFEMFLILRNHSNAPWIEWLRLVLLATSFFMLVIFGARLLIANNKQRIYWGIILSIVFLWAVGLFIVVHTLPTNDNQMGSAEVFTRYSLAIPGSFMTCLGLLNQRRKFYQQKMVPCGRDVTIAALAFGLYGGIGQLFASKSVVFPSPYLNYETFLHWFGFPIQVLRAILACIAAIFIIRSLRSIKVEADRQLNALQATRAAEKQHLEDLRAELLHRTVQAQENERHRIARELHDETGQTLTALGMGLRGLKESIPTNQHRALEQAQQLEDLARDGIDQLQRLVTGLHPPHLDDLGLLAAVRWYAGEINRRFNMPINIYSTEAKPKLTSEIRVAIFRIIQEAITNTIRHANASQIIINLEYQPDEVRLRISDNGNGFDVDQILSQRGSEHPAWGLLGILERASLINGTCSILSHPGSGTTIELIVPLNRAVPHD